MKKRLPLMLMLAIQCLSAQIPTGAIAPPIDWTKSGYKGRSVPIPRQFDQIVNMMSTYDIRGDGVTNDAPAIQAAINQHTSSSWVVFYFPPGTYHLTEPIVISRAGGIDRGRLLILGAGSGQTIFNGAHGEPIFTVSGEGEGYSNLPTPSQASFGSNSLNLPFTAAVGDVVVIRGNDPSLEVSGDPNWTYPMGQILKVVQSSGTQVTFDEKLRLDFSLLSPQVAKLAPIGEVGFEDFSIVNNGYETSEHRSYNFSFSAAIDCWMTGIDSRFSYNSHVGIGLSKNIEITQSYFHEAQNYGGGGHGYGVSIGHYSSSCLIENNIFSYLRHAMIVSNGANGNVFGFNYSTNQTSPFQLDNGDISLHGHFPFANLFEGNYAEFACADLVWGINGPKNAFFRNRLYRVPTFTCPPYESRNGGIEVEHRAGYNQNFFVLGNTTGSTDCGNCIPYIYVDWGDLVNPQYDRDGNNGTSCGMDNIFATGDRISFYKASRPQLLSEAYTWPPLGCKHEGTFPTGSIPARERFESSEPKKVVDAPTVSGMVKLAVQNDLSGATTIGRVGLKEKQVGTPRWSSASSPGSFLALSGSSQTARTEAVHQSFSGQDWRLRNWNNSETAIQPEFTFVASSPSLSNYAQFRPAKPTTLQAIFLDASVHGKVLFRGSQQQSPYTDFAFMPPLGTSIGVPVPQPSPPIGLDWLFLGWNDGVGQPERAISLTSPQDFSAYYKAHRATNAPSTSNAQNQRRLLSSGNFWAMVYESAGDAWLTTSSDNGVTWTPETRLNDRPGYGLNPTLSDICTGLGGDLYYVAAWLEQNVSGSFEIHLQTLRFNWPTHWGWSGGDRGPSNHKVLTGIHYSLQSPSATARITLAAASTSPRKLIYAYEKGSGGITAGEIVVPNDLNDAYAQSGIGTGYQVNIPALSGYDQQPVVIYHPAAYGFAERRSVYFLASGYASGLRVGQWNFGFNSPVSLIPGATGDYTYMSIQGAPNPSSASYGLVTQAHNGVNYRVNFYSHPTYYGTSAPSLVSSFTGYAFPTLMTENIGAFGSPTCEIVLKSESGSSWYRTSPYGSPAYMGSSIAGVLAREQVGVSDRKSMPAKTSTNPATFVLYPGSGVLAKKGTENDIAHNKTLHLFWTSPAGDTLSTSVALGLSAIEIADTMLIGKEQTPLLKVARSAGRQIVLRQADSPQSLSVNVIRAGRRILASLPTRWREKQESQIGSLADNDLIQVLPGGQYDRVWGYVEIRSLADSLTQYEGQVEEEAISATTGDESSVATYPNPFNPDTRIEFFLPAMSQARLAIYNMLGQEIEVLHHGILEAGRYSFRFDGGRLPSGTYLYRLTIGERVLSGRIVLSK